jgi:hypothetical protein
MTRILPDVIASHAPVIKEIGRAIHEVCENKKMLKPGWVSAS